MDDAPFVGGGEAAGNLKRMIEAPGERQRSALEPARRDSPSSSSVTRYGASLVVPNSWTVKMLGWFSADAARASCSKRCSRSGSLANARGQHLDGDLAAEARVAGAVDLAHAACAERRHNLVRTEAISFLERHQRADSVSSRWLFHNH